MAAPRLISLDNAKALVDALDCFLLDCDGVLWHSSKTIDGAVETVKKLKQKGKKVFYVTNNNSKTQEECLVKCLQLGFPAEKEDVICASYVLAAYLKNVLNFTGKVYLIGSMGVAKEFENHGINYTGVGPDVVGDDEGYDDWMNIELDPQVNCVCIGFDKHISYRKILKASSYIRMKSCMFLATNEDTSVPLRGDVHIAGAGSIVAPVKAATGVQPTVVGKPHQPVFDVVRKLTGADPSRTVMVGDRLDTDIALGHNCGLHSILVLTGCHSLQDVDVCSKNGGSINGHCIPEYYIPSFGDLGQFID